jgi:hypothetical protein
MTQARVVKRAVTGEVIPLTRGKGLLVATIPPLRPA